MIDMNDILIDNARLFVSPDAVMFHSGLVRHQELIDFLADVRALDELTMSGAWMAPFRFKPPEREMTLDELLFGEDEAPRKIAKW